MSGRIALCIDEASCLNPGLIGLDGEALDTQDWLDVFTTGEDARRGVRESPRVEEAWVVSSDDVDAINLAATLKSDFPSLTVKLVSFDPCGSLYSRAHAAGIDEVLEGSAFPGAYGQVKEKSVKRHAPAFEKATHANRSIYEGEPSLGAHQAGRGLPSLAEPSHAEALENEGLAGVLASAVPEPLAQPQPRHAALVAVARPRGFILPVVSGSGGAGKSAVSVLGAHIAHRAGYRTLLLDYDLQFGDVAGMAGVDSPLAIDVALAHPERLERELQREGELVVVGAPSRLEVAETVVRGMPAMLDVLSDRFDVIVANTGAAWAEQHAVLLERSSAALFLVDQRASSVKACQHALGLCSRCGIATGPFRYALNRCAKGAALTVADVSGALDGAPVFELKDGGRDVEECLSAGAPADLIEAKNDFVMSLERVLMGLLPDGDKRLGVQNESLSVKKSQKRRSKHAARRRGWGLS